MIHAHMGLIVVDADCGESFEGTISSDIPHIEKIYR